DDRLEVLHLAGNGVRAGVPAVAAPAPVVMEDGVVRRQLGGQLYIRAEGAAAECCVYDHHGRPAAGAVIGDEGPVTRDRGGELVPGCDRRVDLGVGGVVVHGSSVLSWFAAVAGRDRGTHALMLAALRRK